jgi:hypothetical protein
MDALEYKRAALLLYGLQIACSNLKNFTAEHPRPEVAEGGQPKMATGEKEKRAANKSGDEPSLAELLLGMLAKGENEDPDAPAPRIRSREDYYAAVEKRNGPGPASNDKAPAQ